MGETQFREMLTEKNNNRYLTSNKSEKGRLLDYLEKNTKMHRKALVRALNRCQKGEKKRRGGSKPKYGQAERKLVELVWEMNDQICGERMFPLTSSIDLLRTHGYLGDYSEKTIGLVSKMPLGTLKKKLREIPKTRKKRWFNSQGEIRKVVPIRTNFNKIVKAGYFGVDFVDHKGGDGSGKYARTFCTTEIVTQWITRGATRGRDKQAVEQVANYCASRIPMHIRELHSDNEANILNSLLGDFGKRKKIRVTRTRSYQSQDNGHVEQKNGDKIRNVVGYHRYDSLKSVEILNEIYAIDDIYQNYFIRSQRLIGKQYDKLGRQSRRNYDKPQTPYERVMTEKSISINVKMKLHSKKQGLDPLLLRRSRDKLLTKLMRSR